MVDQIIGVTVWSIVGSLVVTVLIVVVVVGAIVWALKERLARGEIDPIEFRVRMAELERDR